MAGGPHAAVVPCMVCLDDGAVRPARRTREGVESDSYRCEAGHEFGLDWSRGPPDAPEWPPPPELLAALQK